MADGRGSLESDFCHDEFLLAEPPTDSGDFASYLSLSLDCQVARFVWVCISLRHPEFASESREQDTGRNPKTTAK